jgi:putative transcriptional regulator
MKKLNSKMNSIQVFRKPKVSEVNKCKSLFAQTVQEKRISLGLTQDTLAKIAGVDRKTINRIENGHFSPNLDTMVRIATVLNLTSKQLINI